MRLRWQARRNVTPAVTPRARPPCGSSKPSGRPEAKVAIPASAATGWSVGSRRRPPYRAPLSALTAAETCQQSSRRGGAGEGRAFNPPAYQIGRHPAGRSAEKRRVGDTIGRHTSSQVGAMPVTSPRTADNFNAWKSPGIPASCEHGGNSDKTTLPFSHKFNSYFYRIHSSTRTTSVQWLATSLAPRRFERRAPFRPP